MRAFELEKGVPFTYVLILIDGNGGLPTPKEAEQWAEESGLVTPVLADFGGTMVNQMPFEGEIPARCAVTPEMELMGCYTGDPGERDAALDAIVSHYEASLHE
jgi:hypothetical protein